MGSENVAYNSKLRGKLQEAGEVYAGICAHNAKSRLRTFDDWKQDRKDFYQHYQEVIEEAISYYYRDDKWQFGSFRMKHVANMLDAYIWDYNKSDINMTTGESLAERKRLREQEEDSDRVKKIKGRKQVASEFGEGITEKNKAALNKNSKSDQQYDLSEGNEQELKHDNLSADQMKGLHDISGWLYRNVDDTGIIGDSAYEFVHLFVEKQPARLKLLAYYLVEKKKRKAPDISDVYQSQTSYVPNLAEFKNQMIATKFKFWKRIDGSHIYWDKLGESMRIALNAQGIVASFASLAEMEQNGSPSSSNASGNSSADTQPPATEEQQIEEAAKKRRIYYAKVVRGGFELADLIREKDAEKEEDKKNALRQQVHSKHVAFIKDYMEMRNADLQLVALGSEDNDSRAGQESIQEDEVSGDDTKTMKAAGYIEMGADALGYAATGLEKFENVEKIGWNIAKADVSILNKISMVTSSASFVTSFVSTIVTLCDWVNHSNQMSASECLSKATDLFASLASFAESGYGMAMAAKGWKDMANFTLEAVSDANAVSMGIASAVTGGITAGAGAVQTGIGIYRSVGVKSTREKLKQQQANLTEEDVDTTQAILDLQGRVANAQATAGAFQTVAGVLQMTGGILNATGVAAIAGTIISVAGTVVSIAGSIVKYMQNKSNINTTIDTYLQTENYLVPIMQRIQTEYQGLKTARETRTKDKLRLIQENKRNGSKTSTEEEKPEPESEQEKVLKQQIHEIGSQTLREQIRIQAAAMAGYSSKEGFYDKIVGDYARFLYQKVFYQDGQLILADSKEAKTPNAQREIYVKMLHNSGLKPVYPTENTGKPKPSLENIARQLRI